MSVGIILKSYPKLIEAIALNDYNLLLTFSNGEKKVYDFAPNLSHPFYKELRHIPLFRRVTVYDAKLNGVQGRIFARILCMIIV